MVWVSWRWARLLPGILRPPAFPAYSWVFPDILARFLDYLGSRDKILETSWFFLRGFFCTKIIFCAFFRSKKLTIFLKFLARFCKIVHILGALGKNLAKILSKGFKNLQDSCQEFQNLLHRTRSQGPFSCVH